MPPEDDLGQQPGGRRGASGITHRPGHLLTSETLGRAHDRLQPGDLVMVWGGSSIASRAIVPCQRAFGVADQACRITHVGLYARDGWVIEATWHPSRQHSGVRAAPLEQTWGTRRASFGRALDSPPGGTGAAVVAAAKARIGLPYALSVIPLAAIAPLLPRAWQATLASPAAARLTGGQVCSTLVFEAYLQVLRSRTPLGLGSVHWQAPFILPAFFFWHPAVRRST